MAGQTLSSAIDVLVRGPHLESYLQCTGQRRHGAGRRTFERLSDDEDTGADFKDQDDLVSLLERSPEASPLKKLAVMESADLKRGFKYSLCRTLRIVDKGVSVVDDGLLEFTCLEELVLSANNIAEVPSKNLPKTLRVLELFSNKISSLKDLGTDPPPLHHLGLGNNRLGRPDDLQYLTAHLWPELRSLDLSWCWFREQYALVDALSGLPHLRSLVLQGNPFTLTPLYPGFTVDSLERLLYLDEARVTSDERCRAAGSVDLRSSTREEAEVTVAVEKVTGVPNPSLLMDDGAPEFPLITHRYSVSYEFLSPDLSLENQIVAESQTLANGPPDEREEGTSIPCTLADVLTACYKIPDRGFDVSVATISTERHEWAEVIEFNDVNMHHVGNLEALKRFFLRGLWLTVEEETVLSRPAQSSSETKPSALKKGKESGKSKDRMNKQNVLDLIHDPPVRRTLGSIHVELKTLLEGKDQVRTRCDLGTLNSEQSARTPANLEKGQNKKLKEDKKEEKKGKPGGETISDESIPSELEPLIVEFSVRLGKRTSDFQAPECLHSTK